MVMSAIQIAEMRAAAMTGSVSVKPVVADRSIIVDESIFNLFTFSGKRTNAKLEEVIASVLAALQAGIVVPVEERMEEIGDMQVDAYVTKFNMIGSRNPWIAIVNSLKVYRAAHGSMTVKQMDMVRKHMATLEGKSLTDGQMTWLKVNGFDLDIYSDGLMFEIALFESNAKRMGVS